MISSKIDQWRLGYDHFFANFKGLYLWYLLLKWKILYVYMIVLIKIFGQKFKVIEFDVILRTYCDFKKLSILSQLTWINFRRLNFLKNNFQISFLFKSFKKNLKIFRKNFSKHFSKFFFKNFFKIFFRFFSKFWKKILKFLGKNDFWKMFCRKFNLGKLIHVSWDKMDSILK